MKISSRQLFRSTSTSSFVKESWHCRYIHFRSWGGRNHMNLFFLFFRAAVIHYSLFVFKRRIVSMQNAVGDAPLLYVCINVAIYCWIYLWIMWIVWSVIYGILTVTFLLATTNISLHLQNATFKFINLTTNVCTCQYPISKLCGIRIFYLVCLHCNEITNS